MNFILNIGLLKSCARPGCSVNEQNKSHIESVRRELITLAFNDYTKYNTVDFRRIRSVWRLGPWNFGFCWQHFEMLSVTVVKLGTLKRLMVFHSKCWRDCAEH